MFHDLYAYTEVMGYPALLKLRVEELFSYGEKTSEIIKRDYILQSIKEESVSERNRLSRPNHSDTNSSTYIISDLFELVKTYDKEFHPKEVNSALLNEDGTPRVVYHGTDAEFTAPATAFFYHRLLKTKKSSTDKVFSQNRTAA